MCIEDAPFLLLVLVRVFDDSETCWHGSGVYEDCNQKLWTRNAWIRFKGGRCKWWHFFPDQTAEDMADKFSEIISGRSEQGMSNSIIDGARMLRDSFVKTLS